MLKVEYFVVVNNQRGYCHYWKKTYQLQHTNFQNHQIPTLLFTFKMTLLLFLACEDYSWKVTENVVG